MHRSAACPASTLEYEAMEPKPPTFSILAEHIVETVREPLLVLDIELRVQRANRSFYSAFAVTSQETTGRLVYELGNGQWDIPALRTLLEAVLPQHEAFDDFEVSHDFASVGRKIMLLNARRVAIEGESRSTMILLAMEDITERRRLEGERRDLETRFTSLVKNVRDHSIFALDPLGHITSWNDEATRIMRFTEREVLGRHFSIIFTDEDKRSGIPEHELRTAMSDGRAEDERWHIRKGGELFWALGIVTPIYNANGTHTGFSKMLRDMTDRKRAEEVVRQSERRFRAFATASEAVFYRMSPDWSALYPMDGKELVARNDEPIRDWLERNIPASEHAAIRDRIVQCIATTSVFDIQHRVYRPDRSVGWAHSRAVPMFGEDGVVQEWIGTAEDVTAQKEAEEALRLSQERLSFSVGAGELGTFYCPVPLGRIEWNQKCKEHFFLPADAEVDFDRFYSMLHADDRERTRRAVDQAVFERRAYDIQYRTVAPDGRTRWVRAKGRAYYDADGNPTRFDGVTLDISEQKRVEAEREHLLEGERAGRSDAERASRMKDEFLATLSHELRTPLNAILGWSQIIKRSSKPDDMAKGIDVIERNARTQAQLIEDLLDMSRIISGKVRLDVQRLDLAAIVQAAVETARPTAEAKSIKLKSVIDPLNGVAVSGDPNRLQQVLWNLLTNAIKFTPKGGNVQVLLERVNSHLEISVIDTGEGIKPEFLPYVFDRFRQADASTTRRHGGLGLGLSIVKQLAELHGGAIRVTSMGEGLGSTFIVSLPLTVTQPQPHKEADRRHPSVGGLAPSIQIDMCADLAGVRVLVVDDEPDARALVKRLLEDCNAVVVTAATAAEALNVLRAERPDVLLSDVGMPVTDGYQLMRQVRALGEEQGGNTPALALTAYARAEDRMQAIRAGFQLHVAKPVEPAELITMVASLAGRAIIS